MRKILVIDDNSDICTLIDSFLSEKGYAVTTATDGAAARAAMANTRFDLVISDVVLYGERGIELAMLARARNIPLLLMSGNPNAIEALYSETADQFIAKPFRMTDMEAAIRDLLAPAQAKRA
ncbi:MAG TPA: response regulator [Stellaceae bacterium]|nr:response regulator [Stellaceae bacterium]